MKTHRALVVGLVALALGVQSAGASPVVGGATDGSAASSALGAEPIRNNPKPVPLQAKDASDKVRPNGVAGGYVFVPISPYRTWDSRNPAYGDRIAGGYIIRFSILEDEYGISQIPADAVAVAYNLTVTETTGSGFASIYPADVDWPGTSSINWSTSDVTLGNGGTVAIGNYNGVVGGVEIYVGPAVAATSTHFVLDITGYYI